MTPHNKQWEWPAENLVGNEKEVSSLRRSQLHQDDHQEPDRTLEILSCEWSNSIDPQVIYNRMSKLMSVQFSILAQQTPLPGGLWIPPSGWVCCASLAQQTPLPGGLWIPPSGWVCCARLPHLTHPPGGIPPSQGGCPYARWADTNNPSVKNKLPPPSRHTVCFWLR